MARLQTNGFESGDSTTNWAAANTAAIVSGTSYTGSQSVRCAWNGSASGTYTWDDGAAHLVTYARFYFQCASLPTGSSTIYAVLSSASSILASVEINSSGAMLLKSTSTQRFISGNSLIAAGTWYLVEVYVAFDGGTGADNFEVKVNGTSIGTYSGNTSSNTNVQKFQFRANADTNRYQYYDDFAINDNTGGSNNSWVGGLTTNITVDAPATNVTLDAQDATVTATTDISISAPAAAVNLDALDATVDTATHITVDATTSNTSVAGLAATPSTGTTITATTSNTSISGPDHTVGTFVPQILWPDSDISTTNWFKLDGTGGFYNHLNSINNTDKVYCQITSGSATLEVGLSNGYTPSAGSRILRYRASNDAVYSKLNFTVLLKEGSTTVDSWDHGTTGFSATTFERVITAGITDYSNLSLQFKVDATTSGAPPDIIYVYWAQFELPPGVFDAQVVAGPTNIAVSGKTATVTAQHPYAADADSSNIGVVGLDAEFSIYTPYNITIQPSAPTVIHSDGVDAALIIDNNPTLTAATITVDALDAEVITMPDAVIIGTDTANIGVDAKEGWAALPSYNTLTETFTDGALESWITEQGQLTYPGTRADVTDTNILFPSVTGYINIVPPSEFIENATTTIDIGFATSNKLVNGTIYTATGQVTFRFFSLLGDDTSQDQTVNLYSNGTARLTKSLRAGVTYRLTIEANRTGGTNPPGTPIAGQTPAIIGYVDNITLGGLMNPVIRYVEQFVPKANVAIAGNSPHLNTEVRPSISNVSIQLRPASVVTPGQFNYGADTGLVTVVGYAPTIDLTRNPTIRPVQANVNVNGQFLDIRTMEDAFKFIPANDNSLTAVDADELVSINLGALLYGQTKYHAFKMGNTGGQPISLTLSIRSQNEDLDDIVQLSTDRSTYSSTIEIGSLQPNSISDPIWFRLNSGAVSPGHGSFILTVEQSNA